MYEYEKIRDKDTFFNWQDSLRNAHARVLDGDRVPGRAHAPNCLTRVPSIPKNQPVSSWQTFLHDPETLGCVPFFADQDA